MKKILVIASYQYVPYFSGGQKLIAQFLDHLGKRSDLTVVGVKANDTGLITSYKYLGWLKQQSLRRYADLSLVKKLTRLIRAEKYDMIIWEHPYFAWLANVIKRRTKIMTVLHAHNIEFQRFRSTGKPWWPLLRLYEKLFFKLADRILFITPEDMLFAIKDWKINESTCIEIAFGTEISQYPRDKERAQELIKSVHGIALNEKILLFNGLLDYKPNVNALTVILNNINPILLRNSSLKYKIVICGKRLPTAFNDLKDFNSKNVIYAGFVSDIETYFKAADIFLNPVQTGGGIKTKMVEAIAFGTTVITTASGCVGIHRDICGEKIVTVADNDWASFANAVIAHADDKAETPDSFYDYYYWGEIVNKVINLK